MFSAWANAKRNSAGDRDQKADSNSSRSANEASTSSSSSSNTYKPYDTSNRQSSSSSSRGDLPPGMVWSPYQKAPIDIARRNALYRDESRRHIERMEARQQARREARQNKEDLGYYSDK